MSEPNAEHWADQRTEPEATNGKMVVPWKWVAGIALTALAIVLWTDRNNAWGEINLLKSDRKEIATKEDIRQVNERLDKLTAVLIKTNTRD